MAWLPCSLLFVFLILIRTFVETKSLNMNQFLAQSIEYASQRSYLDDLFKVYPTIPEGIRDIDEDVWSKVETAYNARDNVGLITNLLDLKLFPIKDSYVAYLKRDRNAISRNPKTINRLAGRVYELGLNKLYEKCSEPKETNRQMGPAFKRWVEKGVLGMKPVSLNDFLSNTNDAILRGSDKEMMDFASQQLGYHREKGLDFVTRFNGKYVIGEAKFLTDFGGHQNAQFNDAIATITTPNVNAIKVAILDGVLYIKGNDKMYRETTTLYGNMNIMSALVLREFLYQL